jgi:hypothetical protein
MRHPPPRFEVKAPEDAPNVVVVHDELAYTPSTVNGSPK